MDHLPPVFNPHRAVQVPYLGGVYGGDGCTNYPQRSGVAFADYPESEGWSLSHLQQGRLYQKHEGKVYERSPLEARRFLQAWLYFGMIQEILGMAIPTADFVRLDESKASLITTEKLRSYLHGWKARINSDRVLGLQGTWPMRDQRIIECFAFSYDFWKGINPSVKIYLLPSEIELSIQILAMTLEHAVTSVCEIPVEMAPWRLARSDFVTNRMIEDGWCPSIVEQIWYPSHLTLQYYASLLGPPKERLRHDDCAAGDSGCKAKNTVNSQYRTKHTETGCDCAAIAIDLKKLAQIIQDGELPVLCLDYVGSKPYLEVVPSREGMHYTAISHVWSDGLGNPHGNTLPECQALEIARLVSALPAFRKLSNEEGRNVDKVWRAPLPLVPLKSSNIDCENIDHGPRYFWMDTLCIPLAPPELRNGAVMRMTSVYSRAIRVLVLDAELLRSTVDCSPEEKLTRIMCSTWIRRLWTLQEAVLARSLYFQFKGDSVVILDQPPGENLYEKFYDNEVGYFCQEFEFDWRKRFAITSELSRIIKVWQAMKSRSTSHAEDEVICMAILLDMDLKKILDVPPSQRVEKLWSMYQQVPAAVLFLPGKKLSSKIHGWAPARCRDCGNVGIPMSIPAYVTSQGLSVTLPGFLVQSPSTPTEALIACVLEGQTFYIRQNEKLDSPSWRGIDISKIDKLAVILGQDPMPDPSQRPALVACIGALVAITSLEGETYHVQYIRMVSIIGKGSRYDEHPNPPWSEQEQKEKTMLRNATYTKVEQAWCVGSSFDLGDSKVPSHDNAL